MFASPTTLLMLSLIAGPFDEAPGIELRYTGALGKVSKAADAAPVKRFGLFCAVIRDSDGGRRVIYHVNELSLIHI